MECEIFYMRVTFSEDLKLISMNWECLHLPVLNFITNLYELILSYQGAV